MKPMMTSPYQKSFFSSLLSPVLFLFSVFYSHSTFAASTLSFQGQIFRADSTALEATSVDFLVKVMSPTANSCELYSETQNINMLGSGGKFSLNLNSASSTRVDTNPQSFSETFSNKITFNIPSTKCASGSGTITYTPAQDDERVVAIYFRESNTLPWELMGPTTLAHSAYALDSLAVGGFSSSSLLRVENASGPQPASALTPAAFAEFLNLLAGTSTQYEKVSSNGAANLPALAGVTPPSPIAGQMWYDSSANQVKYYDGTSAKTVNSAATSITNLTVTSQLTANGTAGGSLSAAGTIGLAPSGVTSGTYSKVTVNSYGQVTANSALIEADLPNITTPGMVSGSAINSGAISGTTSIATSGAIQTSGDMTSARSLLYDHSGVGPGYVGLKAPATMSGANYVLTFPGAGATASGQVLASDTSGNLSWVSPTQGVSFPAPGQTGTAPNWSTSGSTYTLNIPLASTAGVTAGLVSKSDFDILNAKLSASLPSAQIFVGNAGGAATAAAPSGDVSMTNAGVFTVDKIKNTAVSVVAPTTAGQVLRFDGSEWTPNSISMFDLRSTITGASTFGGGTAGCTAGQTLTWTAATDNLSCTNIAINANQISAGVLPVANGGTGFSSVAAYSMMYASSANNWAALAPANNSVLLSNGTGVPTWTALGSDNFSQYLLLAGRAGGQSLKGGTAASQNLTLDSTANATKGFVLLAPTGGNVGIGVATPASALDINGTLRLEGSTSGYSALRSPASAGNITWTLPSIDGAANQVLVTNGTGTLGWATASTGSVTSVGLSLPGIFSVANSPVSSSGTITATLATQTANTIWAGPTTGVPASPSFRSLVAADLPSVSLTSGVSGILPIANGGTNSSSQTAWGVNYYDSSLGKITSTAAGTSGQHLVSNGNAAPTWSAAAFPSSTVANQILFSSAANTVSGLATANNGVLTTSALGVPSISSALPAAVQANITSTGTITSGTWNGSAIDIARGGTNNAALAVTNGGMLYSDGTKLVNSGAGTSNDIMASNGAAAPTWKGLSALMDSVFSSTQGTILYRGASGWTTLAPGTAGQYLQTGGAAANPTWASQTQILTGFGVYSATTIASAASYIYGFSGLAPQTTTSATNHGKMVTLLPKAGTLKNLVVQLGANNAAGATLTCTVYKGTFGAPVTMAATTLVAAIAPAANTASDTNVAHNVTVAANNFVDVVCVCAGGTCTGVMAMSLDYSYP